MLYWRDIREGELLALTPADFDFDKRTVTIQDISAHRWKRQHFLETVTLHLSPIVLFPTINKTGENYRLFENAEVGTLARQIKT